MDFGREEGGGLLGGGLGLGGGGGGGLEFYELAEGLLHHLVEWAVEAEEVVGLC